MCPTIGCGEEDAYYKPTSELSIDIDAESNAEHVRDPAREIQFCARARVISAARAAVKAFPRMTAGTRSLPFSIFQQVEFERAHAANMTLPTQRSHTETNGVGEGAGRMICLGLRQIGWSKRYYKLLVVVAVGWCNEVIIFWKNQVRVGSVVWVRNE